MRLICSRILNYIYLTKGFYKSYIYIHIISIQKFKKSNNQLFNRAFLFGNARPNAAHESLLKEFTDSLESTSHRASTVINQDLVSSR